MVRKMIEYRKANIDDLDEVVMLRIEFLKEVVHSDNNHNDEQLEKNLKEYFIKAIIDKSFISWLAIDKGKIVGTSGLCFYKRPPSYKNITGEAAYIMNMYTVPIYRGRGIASALFEKTVLEAKNMGYAKISLNATAMGKPLYLKFGFKETGDEMVLNIP